MERVFWAGAGTKEAKPCEGLASLYEGGGIEGGLIQVRRSIKSS